MTGATRVRAAAWGTVTGVLLAVVATHLSFVYAPETFLFGDSRYYATTAISVVLDGDLDLRNQLNGGLESHDGEVALGARGEWYPKHPILMPLLTVPLLPLLGMDAFLAFNVAVLLCLGVMIYELAALAARPIPSAAATLATLCGSFLIRYDYNYSSNLFACLLLGCAVLAAARGRPASSGLLGGLSALAHTIHLVVLPLLAAHAAWKGRRAGVLRFLAGAALPLLAAGALNYHMFGSPLVSPYMRALTVAGQGTELHSNADDFDNPWLEGMAGQILDSRRGLLPTAPILLLAAPGCAVWLRRRRDQAVLCVAISAVLFIVFSRYRLWPTSQIGNRFLMPLVAFSAPALACGMQWPFDRARRSNEGATAPST